MKKLAFIALLVLFGSSTYAEDAQPTATTTTTNNARDNYYTSGYIMGLNLGQSIIEEDDISGYQSKNTGFAARPYIGYAFNPYVTFEIGYLVLPTLSYSGTNLPGITIKTSGFDLLLGAKYPLGEGFALYGKVGGAILNSKYSVDAGPSYSEDATVLAYAGGFDYSFANIGGLHMVLDYYHTGDKSTNTFKIPGQHTYSMGIYYLF